MLRINILMVRVVLLQTICQAYKLTKIATVRGVDLFPPPVTWVPPNCIFEVDDIQKEWTWKEPFDLIHLRQLLGSFTPEGWKGLYQQCFE